MTRHLSMSINGEPHEFDAADHRTLIEVLREDLALTGTKDACRQGVCGSCTVLVDGVAVRSCLMLAARCQGKSVTTVEGLAAGDRLSALQQAFVEAGAVQCGYCTSGMLIAATALLESNPSPTEVEVRAALVGNLCRCTGYAPIVRAVLAASRAGAGHPVAAVGS